MRWLRYARPPHAVLFAQVARVAAELNLRCEVLEDAIGKEGGVLVELFNVLATDDEAKAPGELQPESSRS